MGKQKESVKSEAAPKTSQVITESPNTTSLESRSMTYVVVREGFRVSDREYASPTDSDALQEMEFWKKVSKTHSYGEKVEIVPYESKKHRVW